MSDSDSATIQPTNCKQNTSPGAEISEIQPATHHIYTNDNHFDGDPTRSSFTVYDHLEPPCDSPYAVLGNIEEVDLTSFAYQIASGMVSFPQVISEALRMQCVWVLNFSPRHNYLIHPKDVTKQEAYVCLRVNVYSSLR